MSLSLDEYRCKLINKILFAGSQGEVTRYCDGAMKGLENHKVNSHLVARFAEKVIGELGQFNPMDKDAQQWSNIRMATIIFKRIKQRINTPAN